MKTFIRLIAIFFLLTLCIKKATAQGELTNGWSYKATIATVGDSNTWSFTASAGDNLVVRMGGTNFTPYVRLYGPNGALLAFNSNVGGNIHDGEATFRATNSGNFTVVASSYYANGTGDYSLSLAKTGDPIVISPGDEGGPITNGWQHTGVIDLGDLDVWSFTASAGDNLVVRMGGTNFTPYVRLYGPNGALLAFNNNVAGNTRDGEATFRATNSGSFTVVTSSGIANGTGGYSLSLAKTGDPIVISPGDEGGPMNRASSYDGTISVGDLDVWTFTARVGDRIVLQMNALDTGSSLYPQLRLYGRDGSLLNSIYGSSTALISRSAPASGNYTVVASDGSFGGSGTYRLNVNGLSDGLKAGILLISGTNLNVGAVGGTPGTNVVLLTATNVATSAEIWTPILTNQFDQFGVFDITNAINISEPQRFYRLSHPY